MGKIIKNGIEYAGSPGSTALKINYNNAVSELEATNVQEAIDEVNAEVSELENTVTENTSAISQQNNDIEKIRSHVGMIIHSTTLNTMEKVIAIYGGTTWTKIEGRILLGQSSNYAVNSTGGSATNTLTTENLPSHTHSVKAHSHGLNSHTHSIPALSGTAASAGAHQHHSFADVTSASTNLASNNYPVRVNGAFLDNSYNATITGTATGANIGLTSSNGAHTHSVTTNASTTGAASGSTANSTAFNTGAQGSGTAVNNMPPYKTVYIWERTA